MLKGTVALAAASVGVATTMRWRRAEAQESAALPRARIDGVLRQAVDAKGVPGGVAMAATDKGLLYAGAFGRRVLDNGPAMTLDTVFRIASMTKAVTSVAAMQLVEQGKLTLNDPVPNLDPALGSPQVLEGFDAAGAPRLRPAKRPITLRHLLTHTAGFSYEVWDANTVRYVKATGMPSTATGQVAALRQGKRAARPERALMSQEKKRMPRRRAKVERKPSPWGARKREPTQRSSSLLSHSRTMAGRAAASCWPSASNWMT